MINCRCGKAVRLGATKIRVNRRPGIFHYIEHMDGTQACNGPWDSIAVKPYPQADESKAWFALRMRWESYNRVTVQTGGNDAPNAS